jgi:chitodextrinase
MAVSGSVDDPSGITYVKLFINESPVGLTPENKRFSYNAPLDSGENVMVIEAGDGSPLVNRSRDTLLVFYDPSALDTTGPVITVASHSDSDAVYTSKVNISGKVYDTRSGVKSVSVNGDAAQLSLPDWSITNVSLDTGFNTLSIDAVDKDSNVTQDALVLYYEQALIDTTPPEVNITSQYPPVKVDNVLIEGTVSDNSGNIAYLKVYTQSDTVDVAPENDNTWSVTVYNLQPGDNRITAVAADTSGYSDTDFVIVTYDISVVDSYPPTITKIYPEADTVMDSVVDFKVEAKDNTGGSGVREVWIDGSKASATGVVINEYFRQIELKNTVNSIEVVAIDRDSNVTTDTFTLVYNPLAIDDVPPRITFVDPLDEAVVINKQVTIIVEAVDPNGSGISSVKIDNQAANPIENDQYEYLYTFSDSGEYRIPVEAMDGSPNQNLTRDTLTLIYDPGAADNEKPVIQLVSHTNQQTVAKDTQVVEVKVTDNVGIDSVIFAGEEFVPSSDNLYRKTLVLKVVGSNPFTVRAVDVNGLSTSSQFSLEYDPTLSDVTAPTITRQGPLSDSTAVDSVLIEVEVVDDVSGVKEVTIDAQVADTSGLKTYQKWVSGLQQGLNQIIITAVDGSPNTNTAKDTFNIYYDSTLSDNTPPTITSVTPPPGSKTASSSMTIKVNVSDDLSGVDTVTIDSMPATQGSGGYWQRTITLNLGDNNIDIWVRDNQGNDTTVTYIYTYDPPVTPVAITGFTVVNTTNVTLEWEKSGLPDFDKYEVFYHTSSPVVPSGQLDTTISDVNTTSHTIRGLIENTRYHFQVFVYDDQGAKAGGTEADTVTANALPGDVTIIGFSQVTPTSVRLSWTQSDVGDFESYRIFYGAAPGVTTDSTPGPVNSTKGQTIATISGLNERSPYYFKVFVYDTLGAHSLGSHEVDTITPNGPPDTVSILLIDSITFSSMFVKWSAAQAADFDFYRLYYDTSSGFTNKDSVSPPAKADTQVTVANLQENTRYYFKVAAFDYTGDKSESDAVDTVTEALPDTVGPNSVHLYIPLSVYPDSIGLRWGATTANDFKRYILCYSQSSGVGLNSPKDTIETAWDDTTHTVTGLQDTTRYYFRVYVQDTAGNISQPSNMVYRATLNSPPPPVNITGISVVSDSSVLVTWSKSTAHDFTAYEVYYSTDGPAMGGQESPAARIPDINTLSTEIEDIKKNITYYFWVFVVDSGNLSTGSAPDSAIIIGWGVVGNAGFTEGFVSELSLAVHDTVPYVAAKQNINFFEHEIVLKYENSKWDTVGNSGFSGGSAVVYELDLAMGKLGIPYVAFQDLDVSSRLTAMKFSKSGDGWENVGTPGFSKGTAWWISIEMDKEDFPYVAFLDEGMLNQIRVMKFNGTMWDSIGPNSRLPLTGVNIENLCLKLDNNSYPVIAFKDMVSKKVSVMRYTGTSWDSVGSRNFSPQIGYALKLALDSNDVPYVFFRENVDSYFGTVMKFNGVGWEKVGQGGFTNCSVQQIGLEIDGSGAPIVAFRDQNQSNRITVMRFEGAWQVVGKAGFTEGSVSMLSFALSDKGNPYVAFGDDVNSGRATVMKYGK